MPNLNAYTLAEGLVGQGQSGLYGVTMRETTEADRAIIRIRNNSATGRILMDISLAAGESIREIWETGLNFDNGIYVELVDGTLPSGAVYCR